MAKFDFDFPDNMLEMLVMDDDKKSQILNAGAPKVIEAMKRVVRGTTSDLSTGEAVNSIKARKPKRGKDGQMVLCVAPTGYSTHHFLRGAKVKRSYKVSNALKLIWLQYGRAGQKARPWLERAQNTANNDAVRAMQEAFTEITNGHK